VAKNKRTPVTGELGKNTWQRDSPPWTQTKGGTALPFWNVFGEIVFPHLAKKGGGASRCRDQNQTEMALSPWKPSRKPRYCGRRARSRHVI